MEDVKGMLLSKSIWGSIITLAAVVAGRLGYEIDIVGLTNDIVACLGLALAVYGRIVATKRIGRPPGSGTVPLVLLGLLLCSCAHQENSASLAAKSLLTTRQAVIAAAVTVDGLCSQGAIRQSDCDRSRQLYGQAQAAYNTASDALLLYLYLSDPGELDKVKTAQVTLESILLDIGTLADHFGGRQ